MSDDFNPDDLTEESLPPFDPKKFERGFSGEERRFAAECLLSVPIAEREKKARELFADQTEVLLTVYELLRERWETAPAQVREDADFFYGLLEKVPARESDEAKTGNFLLDEREYLLGEAALIAGTTCRFLSRREESRRWFDRAEMWFRSVIGLERDLRRLAFQRLALLTEERNFAEVFKFLPRLIVDCEENGDAETALKCRFLEGNIYKEQGQLHEAVTVFRKIVECAQAMKSEKLAATALYNLVQLYAEADEAELALAASREATPLLRKLDNRIGIGKLQWGLGMLYRRQGNRSAAVEAFDVASKEFEALGMHADVAALRLIIADLLLDYGLDREARREVEAALPIIDEYQLVPEGMAALSLLRESLSNHRIDRKALRELHGYFPES